MTRETLGPCATSVDYTFGELFQFLQRLYLASDLIEGCIEEYEEILGVDPSAFLGTSFD